MIFDVRQNITNLFETVHGSMLAIITISMELVSHFTFIIGIMNRCRSQIGSKMLRVWFQRPTRDLEVLKQRQDAIAFFCCARNFEVTSTLMECQKNIKSISVCIQFYSF